MSIDEKGFLGKQIQESSRDIINKNKKLFDLCFDFNQFAQEVKYRFEIHSKDGQEVIASCLFLKILNGFQAVAILAKYGLPIESRIVLRSLFEPLCILKLVIENEEFHRKYISTDLFQRRKWFNIARNNPDAVFVELRNVAEEYIKRLSDEIEELEVEVYRVEKLAGLASLTSIYNTSYRLLSGVVHTSPRSLEEYITTDKDDNICSINWEPSDKGIDQTLLTSIDFLRMALDLIINFFNVEGLEQLQSLHSREQELHSQLNMSQ